ncbi:MAG TPA: efflux RND transporter periplasmic adaptor subunit [Burkholderiales bacterium]|nr:efflux RND transporter periplasmic adaptor subunit [Burkholderiales bacterium]
MSESQQMSFRAAGDKPRARRKFLLGAAAISLAAIAALVWISLLNRSEASKPRETALRSSEPTVSVTVAQRGKPEQELDLPGNIIAFEEAPIYARVNGYVKSWRADIGDKVKAGQLLAEIETPELDQQLRQAEENLGQVKAKLNLARITAERYKSLLKDDAVSQQEVDQWAADYEARKADYAAALAEVSRLRELKSFQKVYAPFAGTIGERNLAKAARGALIDAGSREASGWLYKLYQTDPLRIYISVPQNYMPLIKQGISAAILVREYPDRKFTGKVTRTSETLDPSSRTLLTEVQVRNQDGALRPGMYATIQFKLVEPAPPIVVPGLAVLTGGDGPHVAVVDDRGVVHLRKVQLGRDFGKTVEVLSGVAEGERLVMSPSDILQDGTKVRILDPNPPSQAAMSNTAQTSQAK